MSEPTPTLSVTLLGSGGPLPEPDRAGPGTLVAVGERRFLFDCGRGVVMRSVAAGTAPNQLTAVLLTHLHSDHVSAFGDVVTTRWIATFAPAPLAVIGPPGTATLVDDTLRLLAPDVGGRMEHHDDLPWEPECTVTEVDDGVAYDDGEVRILAAPTDHRPVRPTVGYRLEAGGRAVVVAGDTVPCEGLDRLCEGADVYVQTVIRRDLIEAIPLPRLQDVLDYHSTVEDAAVTAARAGVGTLVLTHQVPPPQPGTEDEWIGLATAHFDGEVLSGRDLLTVER